MKKISILLVSLVSAMACSMDHTTDDQENRLREASQRMRETIQNQMTQMQRDELNPEVREIALDADRWLQRMHARLETIDSPPESLPSFRAVFGKMVEIFERMAVFSADQLAQASLDDYAEEIMDTAKEAAVSAGKQI